MLISVCFVLIPGFGFGFFSSLNSDSLKDSKSYASELKADSLSCALKIAETLQLWGSDSLCPCLSWSLALNCFSPAHTLLPFLPQKTGPEWIGQVYYILNNQ